MPTEQEIVRVSVIIPCFNHGDCLPSAVASAMRTSGVSFEIIVIDDGSTDPPTLKTLSALEHEHAGNPNLTVLRQANRGPAAARNNGIRAASGAYILPLDADNTVSPDYLAKAAAVLDAAPAVGVVYAYAERFGAQGGIWEFPQADERRLLIGNCVEACSVFRRSLWEQCGGFDERLIIGYEDWDLWLSAAERGWQFHLLREPLFQYRIAPRSRTSACNEPANRRRLLRFITEKHRGLYARHVSYVVTEKDVEQLELYRNLSAAVADRERRLRELEGAWLVRLHRRLAALRGATRRRRPPAGNA